MLVNSGEIAQFSGQKDASLAIKRTIAGISADHLFGAPAIFVEIG